MAGTLTLGVSAIEMGPIASDGGPGTALTPLGLTDADSTNSFTQEDATTTDYNALESDTPVYQKSIAGKSTLIFTLLDPDPDSMVRVMGGTATGTAPNKSWNMPRGAVNIEQTVLLKSEIGMWLTIPRGKVTAKINHDLSKTGGKLAIDISVVVLIPTKAGVAPAIYGPAVPVV